MIPISRACVAHLTISAVALLFACGHKETLVGDAAIFRGDASIASCEPPRQVCSQACTNTDTDPSNCGRCGNACAPSSFCSAGSCARICSGGLMPCGASCIDPSRDHDHCGRCNSPCPTDRECRGGSCHCPEGYAECNGSCINTDQDQRNCGICDRACNADQICSMGSCICAMGTRESNCNDGIDNNCNGLIDCDDPDCVGATRSCMRTCGSGIMTTGLQTCGANRMWSACEGGELRPNVCGDGVDRHCDGHTLRALDAYQPNGSCAQAWMVPGTNPDVTLMPRFDSVEQSEHYFKLQVADTVAYPEHIRITLDNIPAGHDYDLYLYDGAMGRGLQNCVARTPLASAIGTGNMPRTIDWSERFAFDDSGVYYVRVVRFRGYSCTQNYRLRISGLRI